jgi:hypothetical protein
MNPSSNHGSTRATRYARLVLLLLAAALPFVIFGAVKALKSTSNDPRQWLPRSFDETSKYDRFQEHFGGDEIAVVSWPGCTLNDSRVLQLAEALSDSAFFDRVLTGEVAIRELISSSIVQTRRAALRRLRGILIGPDGQTTCLVLSTSAVGRGDRSGAVRAIERLAFDECGLPASELRLAGPTVDAAAIDVESRKLLLSIERTLPWVSMTDAAKLRGAT